MVERVTKDGDKSGSEEPKLLWKQNNQNGLMAATLEEHHLVNISKALDTATSCNNERFEEKSHQTYNNLEQLLLKGDQLSESNEQ